MTEYWVSRKRWTCPYCNITINDDVPSRRQHEEGLRHKGNVERSLKGLYRQSATDRRERNEAEKEMKRIDAAARAAMEKDGIAPPPQQQPRATTSAAPAGKADKAGSSTKLPAWKPKNAMDAYGSVVQPPEIAELAKQEQQAAEYDRARREQGLASEWSTVSATSGSTLPVPQPLAPPVDPLDERETARQFELRERTAPAMFDDDDSADAHAEIRVKKRIRTKESEAISGKRENKSREEQQKPEWKPLRLDANGKAVEEQQQQEKAGRASPSPPAAESERPPPAPEPVEATTVSVPADVPLPPKQQSPPAPQASSGGSSGIFKKRKPGSGNRQTGKIFV